MSSPAQFKRARNAVRLMSSSLVRPYYLDDERRMPLVIEPSSTDLDLVSWASDRRQFIADELSRHGALLLRGFSIRSVQQFEQFIDVTSGGALPYSERSSPRSQVSGNIFTSTDYPASEKIFLHNEQSYNLQFPLKIYFFCLLPAEVGGETPVADTRQLLASIRPDIRRRFSEQGYLYVRNFGNGFGLSWQETFQTSSKTEVEQYCRQHQIGCQWLAGNRLRTSQRRDAIATHPRTGEQAWFNHATFFHVSTLEPVIRERVLAEFPEVALPNNTYYGDGSRIEAETMDHLQGVYLQHKIPFTWQQFDVLMLDNMLAAHGREAFKGQRKVVTGMADPNLWKDCKAKD
ncbi:MAG TPA: TauD/TfdA family dioxygenase [Pyrinomonadaceae bacterium]|nr:TauD/TfdA family dioxygenase [Pyrinomonadaceae bacterium]